MTISIFTTDANLIVRCWDPRLAEMTGLSGEAACGLSLSAIVPDLQARGFETRFRRVIAEGVVETLAPAFHHYLIPCPPIRPSKYFEYMQQRVTIAPLREKEQIIGAIVTIEDVTARLERERELAEQLTRPEPGQNPDRDLATAEFEEVEGFASQRLIQALQDKNWQVRRDAVDSLTMRSDPEITAELLQLLRQQHRNPSILNSVLQVLALSQVDAIPALIQCLKDPDTDLRIYAALALGERKDPRAIEPLIAALTDSDTNVRYHAIEALGRLEASEAVDALIELAESNDFFLAFPALDALMRICDPGIAPRLLPLLHRTLSWRVRREAVDSLARQNDPQITVELLRLLREQHRNPNVLNSVLQVLALSNVDPVPSLIECLNEPDTDLRIYTALALGERQDRRAIPALIAALEDPDANVRYHAIEALGRLRGVEAVDALVQVAESGDFFLGFPAIDALIRINDTRVAPQLIPLLENDLLCTQAAQALSQLGDADVVEPIAALLNQPHLPIREMAVAIAAIYDRYETVFGEGNHIADLTRLQIGPAGKQNLLDALEEANSEELCALTRVLGWLDSDEIARSLAGLLNRPEVRDLAVEALVRYGTRATDLLISQLDAVDLDTRAAAAIALGKIGSTRAVSALTNLLDCTESQLVMAVAASLAQIGDRSSFEALLKLLGHPDVAVRLAAISALNSLGHPAMPERIFSLLSDPNPCVRESAVKIAGYFAFDICIDLLFECCQDSEERVRRAAIEHIPYLEQDRRAIAVLARAISQDSPQVRAAAARAFGEMETSDAVSYLLNALQDEDAWVRYYAVSSIGKLDRAYFECERPLDRDCEENEFSVAPNYSSAIFEAIEQMALHDPANPVRAAATEALGRIGAEKGIPVLGSLVQVEDGEGDVARSAIAALGQIQHPDALEPLLNALNSTNAERRLDALQAFKARGGTEAGVALQWIAAADPETRVMVAAIESLARMGTQEAIASLLELTVDPTCRNACVNALVARAYALGARNDPEFDSRLAPEYEDSPPSDRCSMEAYIDSIAVGLKHVHCAVRSATVDILTRFKHPHASELLILALDDSDSSIRLSAAISLGHLGNHSCDEKLAVLARTDPDTAVRRAAQKILHR